MPKNDSASGNQRFFARGLRGGILTTSLSASARTALNDVVNCPGPIAAQEPEAGGSVTQVHREVADLLGGPRPSGFAVIPGMCA